MRVKKVKYLDGYKLQLLFSDKKIKIVDLSSLINQGGFYFDPLKDIEFFKKVALDDEKHPLSICWPNDADICPDVLYKIGKDVKTTTKKTPKKIKTSTKKSTPATSEKPQTRIAAKSK